MGHVVAQLRHCATSQEVTGSIPDSVIGIFHLHNSSGFTMALGSNRNEYQGYFLGGKGGRYVGLTTLPSSCTDCLEIWEPQPPGNLRACPALYRDCFTLKDLFDSMRILLYTRWGFVISTLNGHNRAVLLCMKIEPDSIVTLLRVSVLQTHFFL